MVELSGGIQERLATKPSPLGWGGWFALGICLFRLAFFMCVNFCLFGVDLCFLKMLFQILKKPQKKTFTSAPETTANQSSCKHDFVMTAEDLRSHYTENTSRCSFCSSRKGGNKEVKISWGRLICSLQRKGLSSLEALFCKASWKQPPQGKQIGFVP